MRNLILSAILVFLSVQPTVAQEIPHMPLHEKIRSGVYPRQEHTLYLNPAPLLVPKSMKKAEYILFELSRDKAFPEDKTLRSEKTRWLMFNAHRPLEPGVWYWRFRSADIRDNLLPWSETYSFKVCEDTPVFATPPFGTLLANAPTGYPRLFAFTHEGLKRNKDRIKHSGEYRDMVGRAQTALDLAYQTPEQSWKDISNLRNHIIYLYTSYMALGEDKYARKMLDLMGQIVNTEVPLHVTSNDFRTNHLLESLSLTYDVCYDKLTPDMRKSYEQMIMHVAVPNYNRHHIGMDEVHIFHNHFWQHAHRSMFQAALLLYDKYPEARQMLEYYYELWATRAPATGFNRDGNWINGTGYYEANTYTLFYVSATLSHFTGFDFLGHPWYHNNGRALMYSYPPNSRSAGFGDGNERQQTPTRQILAFADYIAREQGSPYAAWHVTESVGKNAEGIGREFELRLYRMANLDRPYPERKMPTYIPKALWFRDSGEFEAHSDLLNTKNSLFLSFRSSPFGSGSHTLADQNSFNLHFKGKDVYRSTGYYLNFSDPHNLLSYRHTRAHNTILVNGIGQAFSPRAYGNVVRAFDGEHISYCLGDASKAYAGFTEDDMWKKNFTNSKVKESAENGFGPTPLTKYRRHVLLLHPDKVVIYDELEASEPVRWDWLLHSPVKFDIDSLRQRLSTHSESGYSSMTRLFSEQACKITQTDEFFAAPDMKKVKRGQQVPNQWHMTASYGKSSRNRVLAVIEVTPDGVSSVDVVVRKDGSLQFGDWVIAAQLDTDKPASLVVENLKTEVVFNYGDSDLKFKGHNYRRQTGGSSVLYDWIDGQEKAFRELVDREAIPTY